MQVLKYLLEEILMRVCLINPCLLLEKARIQTGWRGHWSLVCNSKLWLISLQYCCLPQGCAQWLCCCSTYDRGWLLVKEIEEGGPPQLPCSCLPCQGCYQAQIIQRPLTVKRQSLFHSVAFLSNQAPMIFTTFLTWHQQSYTDWYPFKSLFRWPPCLQAMKQKAMRSNIA